MTQSPPEGMLPVEQEAEQLVAQFELHNPCEEPENAGHERGLLTLFAEYMLELGTRDAEDRVETLENALRETETWLTACLECETWHWDGDQRAAATQSRDTARAALSPPSDLGLTGLYPDGAPACDEMGTEPGW